MKSRVRLLRAMFEDGMYLVDERAIADAIVARAQVRAKVPGVFATHEQPVKSFRNAPRARSFRLARPHERRSFH